MRLRRETGDYSIKFTETTNPVLPKNLLAEDLLGAIVELANGDVTFVNIVRPGESVVYFSWDSGSLFYEYNVTTGAVVEAD